MYTFVTLKGIDNCHYSKHVHAHVLAQVETHATKGKNITCTCTFTQVLLTVILMDLLSPVHRRRPRPDPRIPSPPGLDISRVSTSLHHKARTL